MHSNDERKSLGLDGLNVSYLKMTPLARRIAEERGIDARAVQGSGYGGKIYSSDLRNIPAGFPRVSSERPSVEYLRPVVEKAPAEQQRPAIEMTPVEQHRPAIEMTPVEYPRFAQEMAPMEHQQFAHETARAEHSQFAHETPPMEYSRFAQEMAPEEHPRFAPGKTSADYSMGSPEKTFAGYPGFQPERMAAEGFGNPYERTSAERFGIPPERAPAGYPGISPERAPVGYPGISPERTLAGYPDVSYDGTPSGYPRVSPERTHVEYSAISPERAPVPEAVPIPAKSPQRQVISLPRDYLQPSRESATDRNTKTPSMPDSTAPDSNTRKPAIAMQKYNTAEAPPREAMVNAAIAADEDVAGVFRINEARRMVAMQTAKSAAQTAAVTQHMETDVTMLLELYKYLNEESDIEDQIPITAFYLKAMAICIRDCSRFRMRLAEAGDAFLLIDGAHIGLQMDVGDGMATPVIRNADIKSVDEIAAEIAGLTDKARRGVLSEYNEKGSAITLLDKGDSNIHTFTPIINQPSASILGIGSIYQRLVMTDRSIENRQFVMQSLTFDHRVINGSEADEYQRRMKAILEDPRSLVG